MRTITDMVRSGLLAQIQSQAGCFQRARGFDQWHATGNRGGYLDYCEFVASAVDYRACVADACAAYEITDAREVAAICDRLCRALKSA